MIVHFDVHLTHVPTGEQVVYYDQLEKETTSEDWPFTYIWQEGNFSCDCNRALFFERAKTGNDKVVLKVPCGNRLYRLDKLVVRETKEILYCEV